MFRARIINTLESFLFWSVRRTKPLIDRLIASEVIIINRIFHRSSYIAKNLYLLSALLQSPLTLTKNNFNYYKRLYYGEFMVVYKNLRCDPVKLCNYLNMTERAFDFLLETIKCDLEATSTNCKTISAEERLVITLRLLASGESFSSLALRFKMDEILVVKIFNDTCVVLSSVLIPKYLPTPTKDTWLEVQKNYLEKWNFPHCLGSIDGILIKTITPIYQETGNYYQCVQKYLNSILLHAVVDADKKLIVAEMRVANEQTVEEHFKKSNFFFLFFSPMSPDIPKPKPLDPTNSDVVPFVILGDRRFPLLEFLMRPFNGIFLDRTMSIFNYRLQCARQCADETFGIMTAKWRILIETLDFEETNVFQIITAVCVLHNFVMTQEDSASLYMTYDKKITVPNRIQEPQNGHRSYLGIDIREQFCKYFMGLGSIASQLLLFPQN